MNQKVASISYPSLEILRSKLVSYYQLTKPSIMLLVLVTGATALVMEGSLLSNPAKFILVLIALYLTGGCANALNQYFEREVDSRMSRTRHKRPLPLAKISPFNALIFSITIGTAGVLIFGTFFNWLTASLSLITILFYSLLYTLLLKPSTSQNIVIGGAAGAMAPVGAWAAATGTMPLAPWTLFLIVFLWTPPHFWSLAMFCKDDYKLVGYPMLPVLKGERSTLNQIAIYSLAMVASSFAPIFAAAGELYISIAAILGAIFLWKVYRARKIADEAVIRKLFGFSIIYLFGIFVGLCLDRFISI